MEDEAARARDGRCGGLLRMRRKPPIAARQAHPKIPSFAERDRLCLRVC